MNDSSRRPSLSMPEFCRIVDEAIRDLPAGARQRMENVAVDVEQDPDPEAWRRLGRRRGPHKGELLLGLFMGVPFPVQSYGHHSPNVIKIYKCPIEAVSRSRDELLANIRKTVIHETAHHFGFTDADLRQMDHVPGADIATQGARDDPPDSE